jgi:hypothetical protein
MRKPYNIFICCDTKRLGESYKYRVSIHPASSSDPDPIARTTTFANEAVFWQLLSAVLPPGPRTDADAKNLLSRIQRPEGYDIRLDLTDEQAESLGWLPTC